MKSIRVNWQGKEIVVPAQKVAGQLWVHWQGETFIYSPESLSRTRQKSSGQQDPRRLTSPMPGKVIKVLVKAGEKVSQGQTLVVMEAMKMEYNLKASQDAQVKVIKTQEAKTVGLGDLLIELEVTDV